MSEGEFKKRLSELCSLGWHGNPDNNPNAKLQLDTNITLHDIEQILDEGEREYPQVFQKWVPIKGKHIDWKTLCKLMEQKIIEFENFGKKWFGEKE